MNRLALEEHLSGGWSHQPDGGTSERRFATTRFAHKCNNLAWLNLQRCAGHGAYQDSVAALVLDVHIAQLENAHATTPSRAASGSTEQANARDVEISMSGG